LRRIFRHYKNLFDQVKIAEVGIEAAGSAVAMLSAFLLYPFISGETLWKFALDQSQFIFIASIVSCKSESWYDPDRLNPGIILLLSLVLLPLVFYTTLISWDVFVLAILFALTSHLYVYSIAVGRVYIPFAKGLIMPIALILTIITEEPYLNLCLIISNTFLLVTTYRLNYWKQIRMVNIMELRSIWKMKEFILGGILLHQIDVRFYHYLEGLKLSKLEFYIERLVRLFWSILSVRLRTNMLKGLEYSTYKYQIFMLSISLMMTRFSFLNFYLSRYVLQTVTYSGGIKKYVLLAYVIIVSSVLFISRYFSDLNIIVNVISVSLFVSVLFALRVDR